ncbi:MAG: hypothetical protein U0350_43700 [Caldilineaceae bacterium]
MATVTPTELFKAWKCGDTPPEMAMGHVLQNLVILRADVDRLLRHTHLPRADEGKREPPRPGETPSSEQPG